MRKRIPTSELRQGMFVDELCGPWLDHPFWRSRFLLKDRDTLERIVGSAVTEVWIDTAKGADTDAGVTQEESDAQVERQLQGAQAGTNTQSGTATMAEEIDNASRICSRSKAAVIDMFKDVRMGKAVDTARLGELVDEISGSVMRQAGALISLARLKSADEYTYMHSVAVSAMMIALARQLGLPEAQVREAGMAGLLHDVGKAKIPDRVLNKPGALTDGEYSIIQRHPELGHLLLKANDSVSAAALDVCLHHHEKVDGTGYPFGLAGDDISLFARMGAVCDVYDAITSNRPYKRGWDPAESIRKMASWEGHFDPHIFQHFVKSIGIYPTGSLVRLESGRLGVVVEQNPDKLLKPLVKVFFSIRSKMHVSPVLLDLARVGIDDKIEGLESSAAWGFPHLDSIWSGQAMPQA